MKRKILKSKLLHSRVLYRIFVLCALCVLCVCCIGGIVFLKKKKANETLCLEEEEIARLRGLYPIVEETPALIDSLVPKSWGLNFGTIFEHYGAIVTGKATSEIFYSEEKITMVDLEGWDGTLEELKEERPSMVDLPYNRYYWTFEIEEILWKSEGTEETKEALEKLSPGDNLLFSFSDVSFCHERLVEKDQEYLWTISFNSVTGDYELIRRGSYYKTPDDYLFSYLSGENVNQYTGKKVSVYKEALEAALVDPELAGEPWDFMEKLN